MTTCLGKSCSFGLPRVAFVNCCQFYVFSYFPFDFEGRMWDLIVSVPDHCLSFYFTSREYPVLSSGFEDSNRPRISGFMFLFWILELPLKPC